MAAFFPFHITSPELLSLRICPAASTLNPPPMRSPDVVLAPRLKLPLDNVEAILLVGIQGAGKSTFYEHRFASTHLRISLDLAGTKPRERRLLEHCLHTGRDFVIDNTNATVAGRRLYIDAARAAGARVIGYFFPPNLKESLHRNSRRTGKAKVPVPAIFGTLKRLQPPTYAEGFDQLYSVENTPEGFLVRPMDPHSPAPASPGQNPR